jgi:hypothetical protein
MRALAALAVLAVALAGCSDSSGGDGSPVTAGNPEGLPMLHGYIFDPALRPLAGANVKVLDGNGTATTDEEGFFGLDGLPTEQFLVIVATLDGFTPSSKQITLAVDTPVRLNFTLEPIPTQTPYSTTLDQAMLVECQVGIVLAENEMGQNCGTGTQDIDQWDIAVEAGLAGAVVEVFWEPVTDAAASIGIRLETLDLGQLNLVLGETVGESPLRIMVPQSTANRYYPQGGLMRLTVFAEPNSDETEAGAGASILVQQPLDAYASLFYVAPPDPSYSIADQ